MSTTEPKSSGLFVLKREARGEPFKAKVGSTTLTIPHINSCDQFALAELFAEDTSDLGFITSIFRLLMGDEIGKLTDLRLTRDELTALFEAYKEHCGTDVGESPASSD